MWRPWFWTIQKDKDSTFETFEGSWLAEGAVRYGYNNHKQRIAWVLWWLSLFLQWCAKLWKVHRNQFSKMIVLYRHHQHSPEKNYRVLAESLNWEFNSCRIQVSIHIYCTHTYKISVGVVLSPARRPVICSDLENSRLTYVSQAHFAWVLLQWLSWMSSLSLGKHPNKNVHILQQGSVQCFIKGEAVTVIVSLWQKAKSKIVWMFLNRLQRNHLSTRTHFLADLSKTGCQTKLVCISHLLIPSRVQTLYSTFPLIFNNLG